MAEMKAYLTLIGEEFNPDEVTERLKIQPCRVRTKHEILGNGQEFGHYEWGIETDSIEHYDLDPIVNRLIEFIKPRTKLLTEVAKKCCAEWNILFYISSSEDFPAVYFISEFVQLSAEINAIIGFDTYIYPTEVEMEDPYRVLD